jgi:hypothetical protein
MVSAPDARGSARKPASPWLENVFCLDDNDRSTMI